MNPPYYVIVNKDGEYLSWPKSPLGLPMVGYNTWTWNLHRAAMFVDRKDAEELAVKFGCDVQERQG